MNSLLSGVPLSVSDSLQAYAILCDASYLPKFLGPIFTEYIAATSSPPPSWSSTRTSACEICERDWIPLTYHHLIPKETHAKVLKRGWHEEWMLNSVAWLCGACHRFVHGCATNEELAREWWSVDRLMGRDDVKAWAKWRGNVRWKKKWQGGKGYLSLSKLMIHACKDVLFAFVKLWIRLYELFSLGAWGSKLISLQKWWYSG